jgi:hypothetical protein
MSRSEILIHGKETLILQERKESSIQCSSRWQTWGTRA